MKLLTFDYINSPLFNIAIKKEEEYYSLYYIYKKCDEWYICHSSNFEDTGRTDLLDKSFYDLSKMELFDVDTFNASITENGKVYYDKFGIRILDDMCMFISDKHGGIGVSIIKKNSDCLVDYYEEPEKMSTFNKYDKYITHIPKRYIENIYKG